MIEMYTTMVKIRMFETKVSELFAANKIPGVVHLYIGEEAVATGVCATLRDTDYITSTHRGHGHLLAKGGDVKLMLAEVFGKKTGYCKGKGGSMHIADIDLGILGANGIVGGGPPPCSRSRSFRTVQRNRWCGGLLFWGRCIESGHHPRSHESCGLLEAPGGFCE